MTKIGIEQDMKRGKESTPQIGKTEDIENEDDQVTKIDCIILELEEKHSVVLQESRDLLKELKGKETSKYKIKVSQEVLLREIIALVESFR